MLASQNYIFPAVFIRILLLFFLALAPSEDDGLLLSFAVCHTVNNHLMIGILRDQVPFLFTKT